MMTFDMYVHDGLRLDQEVTYEGAMSLLNVCVPALMCVCVRVCVCACIDVCVCACVCVCVWFKRNHKKS